MITTQANVRNLSVGGDSPALPPVDPYPRTTHGMLRVTSPGDLTEQEAAEAAAQMEAAQEAQSGSLVEEGLAAHVRHRWADLRSMRETRGLSERLLASLRAYRGRYEEKKLNAIRQFGGSDVYCRVVALKCRGATSMLRDIYLAGDRPWSLEPSPDPTLPDNIAGSIQQLVEIEALMAAQGGQPVDPQAIQQRMVQLRKAAEQAALKQAADEAKKGERYLNDLLTEGGFYEALVEFLTILPIYPYAIMKGPVVRMATDVRWQNGQATVMDLPKMYWRAPNPMDVYWDLGVERFEDADIIEHQRLSRSELNNLIGVEGYNDEAIRGVLRDYGRGGLTEWLDYTTNARATLETRENPGINRAGLIDTIEMHGWVQGDMLRQYGMTESEVPDTEKEYFVNVWVIGSYVIKARIDPNPRKRHPYYKTSFELVPGATVGHGVPEILHDIEEVMNATLRSLVNNMSIASGPQVVVNDDRVSPNTESDELYPWKRWHTMSDPLGSNEPPVTFTQPKSNAQELVQTFQYMNTLADEVSSIPRYMTGNEKVGGAGRTASGLSMLMQNAGKVMQSVAANVDAHVVQPVIQRLYDVVMLTDPQKRLRGDEEVRVRGVVFANQKEQERARLLEFLQITGNPLDAQILGPQGRGELLREVSERIGLDYLKVVPDQDQIMSQQYANMNAQAAGLQPPGGGEGTSNKPQPNTEAGNVDEGMRAKMRGPSGATT